MILTTCREMIDAGKYKDIYVRFDTLPRVGEQITINEKTYVVDRVIYGAVKLRDSVVFAQADTTIIWSQLGKAR